MDAVISILLQLVSIQEVLGSLLQHEVQSLETLRACLESITQTQKEVQVWYETFLLQRVLSSQWFNIKI